jgi:hypothetical protein
MNSEDIYSVETNKGLNLKTVSGIRVLDTMEESATAIEDMVNKAIREINDQQIEILNVLATGDNLILVLGEGKA